MLNGEATGLGGGMRVHGGVSKLLVEESHFAGNKNDRGGAALSVTDVLDVAISGTFEENQADCTVWAECNGGAVQIKHTGDVTNPSVTVAATFRKNWAKTHIKTQEPGARGGGLSIYFDGEAVGHALTVSGSFVENHVTSVDHGNKRLLMGGGMALEYKGKCTGPLRSVVACAARRGSLVASPSAHSKLV